MDAVFPGMTVFTDDFEADETAFTKCSQEMRERCEKPNKEMEGLMETMALGVFISFFFVISGSM